MSGESLRGKIDQMSRKLRKIECREGGGTGGDGIQSITSTNTHFLKVDITDPKNPKLDINQSAFWQTTGNPETSPTNMLDDEAKYYVGGLQQTVIGVADPEIVRERLQNVPEYTAKQAEIDALQLEINDWQDKYFRSEITWTKYREEEQRILAEMEPKYNELSEIADNHKANLIDIPGVKILEVSDDWITTRRPFYHYKRKYLPNDYTYMSIRLERLQATDETGGYRWSYEGEEYIDNFQGKIARVRINQHRQNAQYASNTEAHFKNGTIVTTSNPSEVTKFLGAPYGGFMCYVIDKKLPVFTQTLSAKGSSPKKNLLIDDNGIVYSSEVSTSYEKQILDASSVKLNNGSYNVYFNYINENVGNLLGAKPKAKKMVYTSNNNGTAICTFIEGVTYLESPTYTASSISYTNNGRVYINMDPDNTYGLNMYNEYPYAAISNLTILASNTVMNTVINAEEDLNYSDLLVRDSRGFIGVKSIAGLITPKRDLDLVSSNFYVTGDSPLDPSYLRGIANFKIKLKDSNASISISYTAVSLLLVNDNNDMEMTGSYDVTSDTLFTDSKFYRVSTPASTEINLSSVIDFNKANIKSKYQAMAPNNFNMYIQIEVGVNSDVFIIQTVLPIY